MGSRSKRLLVAAALVALAGCGDGGGTAAQLPAPPAAKTFSLDGFQPAGKIREGAPTDVSFAIEQPSGKPLTDYAHGNGPHTGVHLMFVRSDLSAIIHRHPPVDADGRIDDKITFKAPGRYRVVVDAYPGSGQQKNFQLFRWLTVAGKSADKPVPAYRSEVTVDGYKVA